MSLYEGRLVEWWTVTYLWVLLLLRLVPVRVVPPGGRAGRAAAVVLASVASVPVAIAVAATIASVALVYKVHRLQQIRWNFSV